METFRWRRVWSDLFMPNSTMSESRSQFNTIQKFCPNIAGIAWILISNYCVGRPANPQRSRVILLAFKHVFIKLIHLIIHLLLSLSPISLPARSELINFSALCSYFDYSLHVSSVYVLAGSTHCLSPICITVDPNADMHMNKWSKFVYVYHERMGETVLSNNTIYWCRLHWLPRRICFCLCVFACGSLLPRCRTSWGGGWW